MRRLVTALGLSLALLGTAAAPPAVAQDSSAAAPAAHLTPAEAAAFGKQVERELAGRGVRVAMVFRAGRSRDAMPDGFAYTHGAFWVHRSIQTADERTLTGYAVHNLYHGDGVSRPKSTSYLAQDWPTDFTRGSRADDVAVIVPTPEMQRRLLKIVDSPDYARLHDPSYSIVANPWAGRHQNCNTFMLDVVGAAAWATTDRRQLAANLRAHFRPSRVETGLLTRVFAPLVDDRVRTDDQSGPIQTAGYESLRDFMGQHALSSEAFVLTRARAATNVVAMDARSARR